MDCDRDELISKLKKKPRFAEHEHHEYDAPSLVSLARSISKPIARFLEDSSDVPPSKEVLIIDSNFYESSSSSDSTVNIENSRDYIKNLVRHRLYKDLDRKLAESQVEGGCECGGNILESKNVKRKEDACDYYLGVVEFATLFVDEVIMKAKEILEYKLEKKLLSCPCVEEEEAMVWPTIGNFAIDIGIFKIKYYVNTFTFEENWRFTVKFLHSTLDALSHFYYYQPNDRSTIWTHKVV